MIEDRRKLRTELFYASGYIRNWQHEPSPSRDLATIASRLRKGQPDNAGGALILKSSNQLLPRRELQNQASLLLRMAVKAAKFGFAASTLVKSSKRSYATT